MVRSAPLCTALVLAPLFLEHALAWIASSPIIQSTASSSILNSVTVCSDLGDAHPDSFAGLGKETAGSATKTKDALSQMREWASTRSIEGAQKAEKLLMELEQQQQDSLYPERFLTNKHYTVVLDAYGLAGDVDKAKGVLQRMMEKSVTLPELAPSPVTINVMLHAYARQNDADGAMKLLQETLESEAVVIRTVDYNVVLNTLAKQGDVAGAQSILTQIPKPNLMSYNIMLEAYTKSASLDLVQLEEMKDILESLKNADSSLAPNAETYTLMIQGMALYARTSSKSPSGRIVHDAQTLFDDAVMGQKIEPTSSLLLVLMNLYANLKDASMAQQLLQQYGGAFKDSTGDSASRATVAYNTILKALKNSPEPSAPKEAVRILQRMEEEGLANTLSYTTFLSTLAAAVGRSKKQGDQKTLAIQAQRILENMKKKEAASGEAPRPNSLTYNSVLHCWSASGNLARAEQLLEEMEQQGSNDCKPTISSYTTVMSGWAKSDLDGSLNKMQRLFDRAVEQFSKGNEECKPNQFAYATLIHALAKSQSSQNAIRAEELLRQMYEEYQSTKSVGNVPADAVIPNTQLVTSVMDCWKASGAVEAGERAESLLNWMIASKEADMRPNAHSFSSAISAWARTRAPGKAIRARKLLETMARMYKEGDVDSPPNAFCFTNVINSCAYCIQEESEKKASLAIAVQTYKQLLQSKNAKPTYVTFATFLTALRNLSPEGKQRSNAVRTVFETAKKLGQVHALVIKKTEAVLSEDEMGDLVPAGCVEKGKVQAQKLPKRWSQNVK